jgi:choline dehydrogenase-like flavoprotein
MVSPRITRRGALSAAAAAGAGAGLAACGGTHETRAARQHDDVDVVVVGAGWAGSQLASQLADPERRSVVVLETGPPWTTGDLVSSMTWSRRLKWMPGAVLTGENPLGVPSNGWGFGGAALHHWAVWLRFQPEDFEVHKRFGRGRDWPFGYAELRPYYDRVQETIGISGDTRGEIWRPPAAPYPMPPLPETAQGPLLRRGFQRTGIRVSSVPRAINSVPRNGRPPCELDAWCEAGCAIGALANPLVTTIPTARRRGAEFRSGARVSRVLTSRGRAVGVEYVDAEGHRHLQGAKLVVLAAFIPENSRILLSSAEGGLANSSGNVGRYVGAQTSAFVYGLFDEDTEPGRGWPAGQLLSQDSYAKDPGRHGYLGSYSWTAGTSVKPNDYAGIAGTRPDLVGDALTAFMRRADRHLAAMTFYGESIQLPGNRLTLTGRRDDQGIPIAEVHHTFDPDALRVAAAAAREGDRVMAAAGAREHWMRPPSAVHRYGGTIMGDDPRTSVVTGFGQTHDIPNLFTAGSGMFPTNAGVNPTFTLAAVALRTGDFIRERWRDLT